MTIDKTLEQSIKDSMKRHYASGSFEEFSWYMIDLGVSRITHDALTNESHFYSDDSHIYTMKMDELVEAQKEPWSLGAFDSSKVQKAIDDYDNQKIDAVQFHKDIFSAGIVFGTVFLKFKKIFYQAADGQYYLEDFS